MICKRTSKNRVEMRMKENAKKIAPFRDAHIAQYEAEVLQEIEQLTNMQFTKVNLIERETQMGFTIEKKRVTGINLYNCGVSMLPESLTQLKSLQNLYLYGNKLTTTLPES